MSRRVILRGRLGGRAGARSGRKRLGRITGDLLDEACGVRREILRRMAAAWSSGKSGGQTKELSAAPLFGGWQLRDLYMACLEIRVSGRSRLSNDPVGFLDWMSSAKDHRGRAAHSAPCRLEQPSSRWRFPRGNRL